jgi:hypothetical protein
MFPIICEVITPVPAVMAVHSQGLSSVGDVLLQRLAASIDSAPNSTGPALMELRPLSSTLSKIHLVELYNAWETIVANVC